MSPTDLESEFGLPKSNVEDTTFNFDDEDEAEDDDTDDED